MSLPLKWEYPGGKFEAGESEQNCINRELLEELGIEVEIIKRLPNHIHHYEKVSINLIPFLVKFTKGPIQLKEYSAYQWLRKEDFLNLDWAPADLPIVYSIINASNV